MLCVGRSHQTLTVGPVPLIEVMDDVCLQHLLHSNKHHTQKINNLPGKCILSISIKGKCQTYNKTQVRYKMSCTYIYIDFEINFMYRL